MSSSVFQRLVKEAVAQYRDPWEQHGLEKLPAELVTRHVYLPAKGKWQKDVSLVKMESIPFDRGAQRQVYRMKKISQAPTSNWKKDPLDWKKAPNYVVKCYITPDGSINTDEKNRVKCFEDVKNQHEASYWASQFNKAGPPKRIMVIQCYALELSDREGKPVVCCERFVDGHDKHGAGFMKHNSNSGFVDDAQSRSTPQAFSAHSFYESQGKLMVVDIQGVGDLYTDPQIHSQSAHYGDSDLGIRGMGLFFVSFRRNPVCDALHLPRFPLSNRERGRIQSGSHSGSVSKMTGMKDNLSGTVYADIVSTSTKGDLRNLDKVLTENPSFSALSVSEQRQHLPETLSVDDQREVDAAFLAAETYASRVQSLLRHEHVSPRAVTSVESSREFLFDQFVKFKPTALSSWTRSLQQNTGEVHLEVAMLEAAGRFAKCDDYSSPLVDVADITSCLFHLCEASMLGSCAAALALGRLRAGLGSSLLEVLGDFVAADRASSLSFFQLAAVRGSVPGAWHAAQILEGDGRLEEAVFMYEALLVLMGVSEEETDAAVDTENTSSFNVGERVEGNHCGCGAWYPARILEKTPQKDGRIVYYVQYADGEKESVSEDSLRRPAEGIEDILCTGIETTSEDEPSGSHEEADSASSVPPFERRKAIGDDGSLVPELFEVYAALGKLKADSGDTAAACQYYSDAAESAMEMGKPKLANKYIEASSQYE